MCDSRRSSRAKKAVSYSGFDAGEDSDDDFARATPPPSKRTKLDKKAILSKTDKSKEKTVKTACKEEKTAALKDSQNSSGRGGRKERVSLDEKLFDREMQLALELSMQESQESQTNEPATNKQTAARKKDIEAQIHTEGMTTDVSPTDDLCGKTHSSDNKENMVVKTAKPPPSFSEPSDEIILVETLDEDEVAGGRRKRKAAKAAVARQREMASEESDGADEEEFKADSGDDGSSDNYDSGDADSDYEEFASSKKKTKSTGKGKGKSPKSSGRGEKSGAGGKAKKVAGERKAKPTPKATKTANSTPKSSAPATPLARRPQATGPIRGFTPPAVAGVKGSQPVNQRAIQSPPVVRRPGWSSPSGSSDSNPLGGVKLVSPGQPIRLGLSRNVRIKPLHPNVKAL